MRQEADKQDSISTDVKSADNTTTETPQTKELAISSDSVLYVMYVLYKAHIIHRNNMREILNVIRDSKLKTHEELLTFLVEESKK